MQTRSKPAPQTEKSLYINTRRMRFHIKNNMLSDFAISRDGARVAWGRPDGCVVLLDATSGKEMHAIKTEHIDRVTNVCFSNDGMYVASGGDDGCVIISDCLTGEQVNYFDGASPVTCVAFSDDGKYVAYSYKMLDDIVVRNVQKPTAQRSAQLEPVKIQWSHGGRTVTSVAFSGDGTDAKPYRVASGGRDGRIVVWDGSNGTISKVMSAEHAPRHGSLAFSGDGRRLASSGKKGCVMVFDVLTGEKLQTMLRVEHHKRVMSVAFSHDGTRVVSGWEDGRVAVFDAASGQQMQAITYSNANFLPVGSNVAVFDSYAVSLPVFSVTFLENTNEICCFCSQKAAVYDCRPHELYQLCDKWREIDYRLTWDQIADTRAAQKPRLNSSMLRGHDAWRDVLKHISLDEAQNLANALHVYLEVYFKNTMPKQFLMKRGDTWFKQDGTQLPVTNVPDAVDGGGGHAAERAAPAATPSLRL